MSQIVLSHSNQFEDFFQSEQTSVQKNIPKNKLIRKKHKKPMHMSKILNSETTNHETPTTKNQQLNISSCTVYLKSVFLMIKDINIRAKYSLDTYLVCLKILQKMSFKGDQSLQKLIAASIVSIVGKVHQYRVPRYEDLIQWGKCCFDKFSLINIEAQILRGINFQVPLANEFSSQNELKNQIRLLEQYFN